MNMVANAAVVAIRSRPTPQETPTAALSLYRPEKEGKKIDSMKKKTWLF
ncbi:MAG: hypothetical protein ACI90V_002231 [Bacillariaceae sp.]|jgi:hypothetical protein